MERWIGRWMEKWMSGQSDREKPRLYFATEVSCYLTLQQTTYIVVTYLYRMTLVSATKCSFQTTDTFNIISI